MKVNYSKPRQASEALASVQLDVPTNAAGEDRIGILVGLWCQKDSVDITTPGGPRSMSFGFRSGDLCIEASNARIALEHRYSEIAYEVVIDEEKKKNIESGMGIG